MLQHQSFNKCLEIWNFYKEFGLHFFIYKSPMHKTHLSFKYIDQQSSPETSVVNSSQTSKFVRECSRESYLLIEYTAEERW